MLEEGTSAASHRPEILALHYFVAGRYEWAWRYARQAGERAAARYAPAAAADAYARAAEAARRSPEIGADERSVDLEALGDALFLAGRSPDAADAYREALRTGRGDPLREAHLALKLARVEHRRGRYAVALRRTSLWDSCAGRERRRAGRRSAGPAAGAVRGVPGESRPLPRRSAVGAACRRRSDGHRRDGCPRPGAPGAAYRRTVVGWSAKASGTEQRRLRLFEQLGDLGGQAHALNNLALRRFVEGRWPDALPMFARAAETFRRVGDATNAANADYNRADILVRQGRSDEALPLLQGILRIARAVGDEELVALVLKEQGRARSRARPCGGRLGAAQHGARPVGRPR